MFTKVWKDFKNGKFAPVYLLVGEESYFIDETIMRLKEALGDGDEVEVMTFDLNEQPIDYVIDEADTIPFFSDRKCIIAKNASFLKATDKGKEKIDHDLKRLENWLGHPSDTAITLFIAPYEKLDERKKVTKLMKEKSVMLLAETPQNNDLYVWIQSEVEAFGKVIADDAAVKLVEMVGAHMLQLQQEIEKLALYLGEDYEITVELVEDLVAKTLEHDAFKMLNAYLAHNQAEALKIYHDLLRQKEEPIMLVGLLASNIRTMSNVYYLQKKGYHPQQIAKQLKIHPYRVKMITEQRNRPSDERLLQALYSLAQVDLQLKTTGGNRERHLELFLMKAL
ncbi:DNA polymerase III subunit delta [Solibacillus sp. FSL H8-0538]|uniref:DNA polymerase III subunit delta n=1 Tax=Solibacillus sp. FSL H8-0538 TaxID=2921400 RepID=UPI0030FC65D4